MKNKNINYGLIVFIVVIIILFVPIICDYIKSRNIEVISKEIIVDKIKNKETFLVYVGDTKDVKKELRTLRDKTLNDYSYEYGVYSVDSSIDGIIDNDVKVALYIEGDLQQSYNTYDYNNINSDVSKYFVVELNDNNRSYKIAENFKTYKKLVKSDEVTMAVFGRDNCYYCNKFKPVYDAVAEKYGLDIYYFDSLSYDANEYKKIINLDLTVPSKCNSSNKEFKLSDGFGTPLTIYTKNGKVIDCIGGYVDRATLIQKLNNLEMISE
ncbi:MAG: thioredoxin family protein [Bacilli bacterium]|nr:thioredoxin family protein [Bacilli bacterium]